MSSRQHQPAAQTATQRPRPTITLPQQAIVPSDSTSSPVQLHPQSPSQAISLPENTIFPTGDPRTVQMNRIRHFLANIGGRPNLQPEYAQLRLTALCFAVIHGDMLFLILHQIFCLWSTKPHEIPGSIRTNPGFKGLMTYLAEILCSNEHLHQSVLTFFSQFPEPLPQFVLNSSSALEILQQIATLINGMQQRNALVQHCMQRKYPPLANELRECLCIRSDRLMDIVFTAILRQLWGQLVPYSHPLYDMAHKVFRNDLITYKQAAASGSLPSDQGVTINNYVWLYSQLRDAGVQSQAVQVAAQPQMYQQFGPNTMRTGGGSPSTAPVLPFSTQQATTYPTLTQAPSTRRTPVSGDSHQLSNHVHPTSSEMTTNLNWVPVLTQEKFPRKDVNRKSLIT